MKGKKIIIAVAAIAAAAVAAFLLIRFLGQKAMGQQGTTVYVQSVNSVNAADKSAVSRFSGVVENQKSKTIDFDTSLTLNECYVEVDTKVKEGDKLFSYNTESTQLEIQQKQLSIERLNTTIANDNEQITSLTAQMNKASADAKLEYSAQILELQAEVAQAQYDSKLAQSEIDKLNKKIEQSTVTAPMDGIVTKVTPISDLTDESKGYITITAEGEFRVKGKLNEQNITDISEGEAVLLRSRLDENRYWKGTVTSIETTPQSNEDSGYYYYSSDSSSSTSSYAFYVELDSTEDLLLGQHLTIEKDTGVEELSGIWISGGWITQEEGKAWCWAAASSTGTLEKREVTLGTYNEELDLYEIVSGLEDDEYLAWPDAEYQEGMKVSAQQSETGEETDGTEDGAAVEGTTDDGAEDAGTVDGTVEAVTEDAGAAEEAVIGGAEGAF